MLTKNYFYVMAAYAAAPFTSPQTAVSGVRIVDENGTTRDVYTPATTTSTSRPEFLSFGNAKVSAGTGYYSSSVIFGTGTNPPAIDDYDLSGDTVSTISQLSAAYAVTCTDAGATSKRIFTIQNTGTEAITICESAWMVPVAYSTSTLGSSNVMFDRTVFDTPITIPAGGTATIEYAIEFTY